MWKESRKEGEADCWNVNGVFVAAGWCDWKRKKAKEEGKSRIKTQ